MSDLIDGPVRLFPHEREQRWILIATDSWPLPTTMRIGLHITALAESTKDSRDRRVADSETLGQLAV